MTSPYQLELDELGHDFGPLPDPATPAGEAMAWWLGRVRRRAYVGLRDELPSPSAARVLRDRELVAETPGGWAFAVRGPHTDTITALHRNAWGLVAAALQQYAPAAIDRVSAVRLATGEEAITPAVYVRHAASRSKRQLAIMEGYEIILRPDAALAVPPTSIASAGDPAGGVLAPLETTSVTLGATPAVTFSVLAAAELLTSLTVGDLRDHLDLIVVWLRTLVVGRTALERAFTRAPRPVLLKRMGDLAHDAGNARLATTIDNVVAAHSRSQVSRTLTGVGRDFVVPSYISTHPTAPSPWLERHRVRFDRAVETLVPLLAPHEMKLERLGGEAVLAFARAAKAEDTYHSTTIEGYRITRDEVRAVLDGQPYGGRSAQEIERLMALKGYAQAFDWVLARIREVAPPVERPVISESFLLDLFLELWAPSVDAGVVDAPALRAWRNHPVQINGSDHVPPASEKLGSLMTQFVHQLNAADVGPLTRAVLGHWVFVHLHPFKDGNGRVARLLMNYLLSAAGLPWTTIRAEQRARYFAALERAHIHEDLAPFGTFIAEAVARARST